MVFSVAEAFIIHDQCRCKRSWKKHRGNDFSAFQHVQSYLMSCQPEFHCHCEEVPSNGIGSDVLWRQCIHGVRSEFSVSRSYDHDLTVIDHLADEVGIPAMTSKLPVA